MNLNQGSSLQQGKYEIIRMLGQGGFGVTYLARHTLMGKTFCIKEFFPKDYCNRDGDTRHITVATVSNRELVERLRSRFITEAQNISGLNHPGIIQIHDVFQENGTAYYVMDYIEGMSLDDLVKQRGALSEAEAVDYVIRVASALQYIHDRKMTHFDVKPANIMINSADGSPVLIDFGLSKQFTHDGQAKSTLLVGLSHGYSPIEQYYQDGITGFSPQTDVYALGATLYTLLTGRIPPEAPRLTGTTIELPLNISQPVANAVKWAMVPDINSRCQCAKEFSHALTHGTAPDRSHTIAVATPSSMGGHPTTELGGGSVPPASSGGGSGNGNVNYHDTTDTPAGYESDSEDYYEEPKKRGIPGWAIALIVLLLLGIGALVAYIIYDSNKPTYDPYANHGVAEEATVTVEEVEVVEVPAEEAVEEVEAVAAEASPYGTFYLEGNVDGYPITVEISWSENGYGGCNVEGKYAYHSTLKKYGDKSANWFYFKGKSDSDGSNLTWTETTPSNPDYETYFEGSFRNGVLRGKIGTFSEDDTEHYLYAEEERK